jgi:hypothetical protein
MVVLLNERNFKGAKLSKFTDKSDQGGFKLVGMKTKNLIKLRTISKKKQNHT